jgi:parallel beta-helix repeat protein
MYLNAVADMRFATAGQDRLIIDSTAIYPQKQINSAHSGTAGTVNYGFNNDENTGMYSSGAETLDFSTAGVQRLTITSAGRVGIATSSPGSLFSVQGIANFAAGASQLYSSLSLPFISASSTTATSTFAGGIDVAGGLQLTNLNCTGFSNGGKLVTDSSGNVICGNDTSAAGGSASNMDDLGDVVLSATTTGQVLYIDATGKWVNGGTLTYDGANSRIGIGTTSPMSMFTLTGNGTFASTTASMINGTIHVDGVHYRKNHDGFQGALDDCEALNCGKVVLPAGNFDLNASTTIPSNIIIEGVGSSTILTLGQRNPLYINVKSNVTIRNLSINAHGMVSNDKAIHITNSTDIVVDHVDIIANGFTVFADSTGTATSQRIWITHNDLRGRGNADVIGGGPQNSTGASVKEVFIKDNFIKQDRSQGAGQGAAVNFVQDYRIHFEDNIVEGDLLFGTEQWPTTHAVIRNNTVKKAGGVDCSAVGAIVVGEATQAYDMLDFSGNTLENSFIDVFANPTSGKMTHVTISNNRINASGCTEGILVVNTNGGVISGNIVASSTDIGIEINGSKRLVVSDNVVEYNTNHGIKSINASADNTYSGNKMYGNGANYSLVETNAALQIAGGLEVLSVSGKDIFVVATSTGFVGIGSTTPASPLSVQGNALVAGNLWAGGVTATSTLTLTGGLVDYKVNTISTVLAGVNSWAVGTTTAANHPAMLSVNGLNNRVGIGTIAPATTLDVRGTISASANSGSSITMFHSGTEGAFAATGAFSFQPSGDLAYLFTSGTNGSWRVYGSSGGSNYIQLTHNNTVGTLSTAVGDLVLSPTGGDVGIGTTTPGSILSIQGAANFAPGASQIYSSLSLPFINATSTTATSTFSGILESVTKLLIPFGTDPTINTNGQLALNTNSASTSLRAQVNGTEVAFYASRDKSLVFASSTLAYLGAYRSGGTTTVLAGNFFRPTTVLSIHCKTDTGTAYLQLSDGTNKTETVACTTTGGKDDGSLVNNTWVMREDFKVEVGSQSGNPNTISISTNIREDAD